jgi:hypothetical protein
MDEPTVYCHFEQERFPLRDFERTPRGRIHKQTYPDRESRHKPVLRI